MMGVYIAMNTVKTPCHSITIINKKLCSTRYISSIVVGYKADRVCLGSGIKYSTLIHKRTILLSHSKVSIRNDLFKSGQVMLRLDFKHHLFTDLTSPQG